MTTVSTYNNDKYLNGFIENGVVVSNIAFAAISNLVDQICTIPGGELITLNHTLIPATSNDIRIIGNGIQIVKAGYYKIDSSFTITSMVTPPRFGILIVLNGATNISSQSVNINVVQQVPLTYGITNIVYCNIGDYFQLACGSTAPGSMTISGASTSPAILAITKLLDQV